MSRYSRTAWLRRALPLLAALFCMLFASTALADRIDWKSKNLKESGSGAWTIELTVYMTRTPDVAHVPMRFSFEQTVYYERNLVDGKEGPQLTKRAMMHQQPIVESVDVGFMDPGSGKIQKRTRFSFKITRDHGFEAGEYKVTITNSRNNSKVGPPTTVILNGENEVVDRRAMVFTGKDDDKKKEEKKEEKQYTVKEGDPDDPAYWEGGPSEPDTVDESLPPPEGVDKGPCGCRIPGRGGSDPSGPLVAGALFALGAWLRRRH